jgi:hypothetical protein
MPYMKQDLDLVQRHAAEAAQRAQHQRYLLDQLHRAGQDAPAGHELLQILETAQRDLMELRDRIVAALQT